MKIKGIEYILNPSLEAEIVFSLRSRNQGLTSGSCALSKEPEMSQLLSDVAEKIRSGGKLSAASLKQTPFMIKAGLLIARNAVPEKFERTWTVPSGILQFVPSRFRHHAKLEMASAPLIVNSGNAVIQDGVPRPQVSRPGLPPANSFPQGPRLLWVFDPGPGMWAVYGLSPQLLKIAKDLLTNRRRPTALTDGERELFFHAGLLTTKNSLASRTRGQTAAVKTLRSHLARKQFAVLRSIVPALQIALLRRTYRALEENGYLEIDEKQVREKRYFHHNDRLLQFLHRQTAPLIRAVTNQIVIPSYSFLSAYKNDAALAKHKDRPQCAWNVSLLIDQRPEVDFDESWPIFLEVKGKKEKVQLDFGDALLYSGTELAHWRPNSGPRNRQTLGLLHYVPIEFTGDLD